MTLKGIHKKIKSARQTLKEINPSIECSIVAMFGTIQLPLSDLHAGNTTLFFHKEIFEPSQRISRFTAKARDLDKLERDKEKLQKRKLIGEKTRRKMEKIAKITGEQRAFLEHALNTIEFTEPELELRFYDLDIDEVQRLKVHPEIAELNSENVSQASIRVVIG
ncbi:MAG: hypothetical protein GF401_19610 [Chitinivibrionales bacterium]|nr:hypothetical protein [Chitinivibrionales bacterium]